MQYNLGLGSVGKNMFEQTHTILLGLMYTREAIDWLVSFVLINGFFELKESTPQLQIKGEFPTKLIIILFFLNPYKMVQTS